MTHASCDWGGGTTTEHCPACHQSFTGTTAGDMHRVGDHALSTGPNRRRCLSEVEMLAKGMTRNSRGVWMTPSVDAREQLRQARIA